MSAHAATRIPSGISDEAGTIGVVEAGGGLVDVIDLLKGERLTGSETPMAPLFVRGHELLVHKRDPESGAVILELLKIGASRLESSWTAQLELPEWALRDPATLSLEAEWVDGAYQISWTARRASPGGMRRSEDFEQEKAGRLRIGEESGDVEATMEIEPAHTDAGEAYDLALSLDIIPFHRGAEKVEAPWSIDGREIFLTRRGLGGDAGMFLRFRGSEGKPEELEAAPSEAAPSEAALPEAALPEESLFEESLSEEASQEPVVTADGRTIMLYRGSDWDLFSTVDGKPQGSLPIERDTKDVSIVGSTVIYAIDEEDKDPRGHPTAVRRQLLARDRQSGELLWTYCLGDKELPPDPRTVPGEAPPSMPGGRRR